MVDHPVQVRSFGLLQSGDAPVIVERTDQDFLGTLLKTLGKAPADLSADVMPKAGRPDKPWKLYQPLHRSFYVALVELVCDTPLHVRLDPQKVESAGLVVRRLNAGTGGLEAWMRRGKRIRGWVPIGAAEEKRDPDPARRPPRLRSGNAAIDAKLEEMAGNGEQDEETVSPLFVAPPEICDALQRTLLYGLVPVVSSEMSEAEPQVPPYDDADIKTHLPVYLRVGTAYYGASWSGKVLTFADVATATDDVDVLQFMTMLRQLTLELNAFGDAALYAALNSITLAFNDQDYQAAGSFLKEAARVLVRGEGAAAATPPGITMPIAWPTITAGQEARFIAAIRGILMREAARAAQSETRFQDPARQYSVRAFVRVKRTGGCPPRIWWSERTGFYQVAAWYENNGLPPAQIGLPDLGALANLKPTVAFKVPKPLFDFLQANNMKGLTEGSGSAGGGGVELDWICSFSLPSITLCAFIALNIFLGLFDLIFHWMASIKICIPIPKPK